MIGDVELAREVHYPPSDVNHTFVSSPGASFRKQLRWLLVQCVWVPDMPHGTDRPYPIRILAFFEMIRPYHVGIRISGNSRGKL